MKIVHRLHLRGDGLKIAHFEVFLPPDNGVVGAAVDDSPRAVAQAGAESRKLHIVVDNVDVAAKQYLAEALRFGHVAEQSDYRTWNKQAKTGFVRALVGKEPLCGLAHGYRVIIVLIDYARKVHVRKLRHDKAVHHAKRGGSEGQVASPAEIIHDVVHIELLNLFV